MKKKSLLESDPEWMKKKKWINFFPFFGAKGSFLKEGEGHVKEGRRDLEFCWQILKRDKSGCPEVGLWRRKGVLSRRGLEGASECKAEMQKVRRSGRARGASWGAARGQLRPGGTEWERKGGAAGQGLLRRVFSKGEGPVGCSGARSCWDAEGACVTRGEGRPPLLLRLSKGRRGPLKKEIKKRMRL